MNQSLRIIFVSLYALTGPFLLIELAHLMGMGHYLAIEAFIYILWLGLCFTSYVWSPAYFLAVNRVRNTTIEEDELLHPLLHELNLRSRIHPLPRILILEEPVLNAFAVGRQTIILSRGLIGQLSSPEIKAILAHEYGHLKDKDTQLGNAYDMAGWIPSLIYSIIQKLFHVLKYSARVTPWLAFCLLITVLTGYKYLLVPLLIIVIFIVVFPFFYNAIDLIWQFFSRHCEYRQDAFAQSLGYGRHLKKALLKIDAIRAGKVVNSYMQIHLSHPMIYERVRTLEWLDGLRDKP